MTRTDAAALLGVSEDISPGDLRRRYETLHTDYQIRLTNAPTPALKKTYQQKLQELGAAADILHPGFSSGTTGGDLPATEPMLDDLALGSSAKVSPASAARVSGRTETGGAAADRYGRPAAQDGGLPRSTIVVGVVAVIFAAALSFVVLGWYQASTALATLQQSGDKLLQTAKGLQAQATANEQLFYADRLRVRNGSSKAVRITAAAFVYRDASGAMKLAHSGNFNYPTWEIKPGSTVQLDADMARGRLWDGPVVYYAFLVEYPGVESFLKAGVWAQDIDRLDKVVTLDLD
jgi:hypothetical protein